MRISFQDSLMDASRLSHASSRRSDRTPPEIACVVNTGVIVPRGARTDCRCGACQNLRVDRVSEGRLTKAALVEEVADVADLTKRHAELIVETVLGSIVMALHRGEKVELRGFGSFRLRRREPHRGRNPRTGDRVDVPSKRVAYFTPGKELRELLNREATPARPAVSRVDVR